MYSTEYKNFIKFKKLKKRIKAEIKNEENTEINQNLINDFINSNPNYFYAFTLSGDYYFAKGKFTEAKKYYQTALTKEIATIPEKQYLENKLIEIK